MSKTRFATAVLIPRSITERIYQTCVIVIPLLGVIWAAREVLGGSVSASSIAAFLLMYVATGLGVTLGYHRLLAHGSYTAPDWLRRLLAVLGTLAGQGYFFNWIAEHRLHHACTDAPGDPHSPHWDGDRRLDGWRGLWHAHVGWLVAPRSQATEGLIPDLRKDSFMHWIDRLTVPIVLAGIAAPALAIYLVTSDFREALEGGVWAGPVRIFFLNHTTWCINSICHTHGTQNFNTRDQSRDNSLLAFLALGEGWHNGHHAFPRSARHGLSSRQFDMTFLVIRFLEKLGLVTDVFIPSDERIRRRRLRGDGGSTTSGTTFGP